MLPRKPELIVFDLDGTLVDSAPDIAYTVDVIRQSRGLPAVGEAKVRTWIGNGGEMLIKRALTGRLWPDSDPPGWAEAYAMYLDVYEANLCNHSRLFPGVKEGLAQLRAAGFRLACSTNKHSRFTVPLLEQFGIAGYFNFFACGDQFGKLKPDPEPLLKTAAHFGVTPDMCLMVGDSANDALAARNAGFMLVCVPYGYHGGGGVEIFGPDAVVESLLELVGLLR